MASHPVHPPPPKSATDINVCIGGGDLCSPFLSNFSETPCMKVSFDVRISRWEITFSFVFQDFASTCGEQSFRTVHMLPGQLIASGQLTDPGVNFASVHGLTSVTVHMNLSLPRGNFERRVIHCTTPGNQPCQGNFSRCEQNAKVAPGQE